MATWMWIVLAVYAGVIVIGIVLRAMLAGNESRVVDPAIEHSLDPDLLRDAYFDCIKKHLLGSELRGWKRGLLCASMILAAPIMVPIAMRQYARALTCGRALLCAALSIEIELRLRRMSEEESGS